jgi:hypothetical protein
VKTLDFPRNPFGLLTVACPLGFAVKGGDVDYSTLYGLRLAWPKTVYHLGALRI